MLLKSQRAAPDSTRPSKRNKTPAAAFLQSAASEITYNIVRSDLHIQKEKRAQSTNPAYWNTIMNLGAEEAGTEPVPGVGPGQVIAEIQDIYPIDPGVSPKPTEPIEVVIQREKAGEKEVQTEEAEEADIQIPLPSTSSAHASGAVLPEITPVEEFFDIEFSKDRMAYTIVPLKENMASWRSLDAVASCSLRDERIQNGDYVVIRLQGESVPNEEENYAKVREIRKLPDPDARCLIRIAWLYRLRKRLHVSNHYQVMLWDTVDGVFNTSQRRQIQRDSLYDACQTMQLCNVGGKRKWQALERQTFGHGQK
ncbi:uncharacterized protein PV06_11601 [Exophiala oligosperma]|uniref:BAH domain-containing protein n=1 Tax=Exophiala oligosperma TaxID=215243 RepID=A0A0D2BF17_9EURO|nr:uncharacterized protein PV06_11601 [Exophiala oligosperma]KIW36087.1 hypothetical protein PV06_11601 [Exophiala oligosperma]